MEDFRLNQYNVFCRIGNTSLAPHATIETPGVMSSSDTHFTREYVPLCTDPRLGRWLFHRWKTSESPMVVGGRTASIQRCPGLELDGDIHIHFVMIKGRRVASDRKQIRYGLQSWSLTQLHTWACNHRPPQSDDLGNETGDHQAELDDDVTQEHICRYE